MSAPITRSFSYRREIDGLRAIAVIPVILFHTGVSIFSGGFVGVDVFFVISGYLITSLIREEMHAGTFTITGFYERRARRILPALFLVMAVCWLIALLLLYPPDMKLFSLSTSAVSVFSSNILFWRTAGYFEGASELKPLLHTWSLAVEEQYYLLFPPFFLLVSKLGRRWLAVVMGAVAFASFALAESWCRIRAPFTFYMLPTRGWELAIGVLAAIYLSGARRMEPPKAVVEIAGFLGLLLIFYAMFAFDKHTPFPSQYALVPTLGTTLLILFASDRTTVGSLLGKGPVVRIGLISYSAYLWHFALFAFARHAEIARPASELSVVLFALAFLSLALAYLSWRYIEAPFRNRKKFSRRQIFVFSGAGMLFFFVLGLVGYRTNGFIGRFDLAKRQFIENFDNSPPDYAYVKRYTLSASRYECGFFDIQALFAGLPNEKPVPSIPKSCYVRNPALPHAVFVWGDSHAQQLYSGLKAGLPTYWQILQVASSACNPDIDYATAPLFCRKSNDVALQSIRSAKPDVVIVAQNLDHDADKMRRIAARLQALGAARVVFVGPTPHWDTELPKLVVERLWNSTERYSTAGLDLTRIKLDGQLKRAIANNARQSYVSVIDYFCNSSGCLLYLGNDRLKGLTSYDYGHLTPVASSAFSRDVLIPVILQRR